MLYPLVSFTTDNTNTVTFFSVTFLHFNIGTVLQFQHSLIHSGAKSSQTSTDC